MSIIVTATTVGTAATQIILVEDFAAAAKDGRVTYEILNNGNTTIWIGGDDSVTDSTGTPLPAGGARTLDLRLGAAVYAISTAASQDVRILEVR
jgi:hypothetical protein